MQNNQEKLKEKYISYRIKIKKLSPGIERSKIKQEMSDFLESIAIVFGQDVVNGITKKG